MVWAGFRVWLSSFNLDMVALEPQRRLVVFDGFIDAPQLLDALADVVAWISVTRD